MYSEYYVDLFSFRHLISSVRPSVRPLLSPLNRQKEGWSWLCMAGHASMYRKWGIELEGEREKIEDKTMREIDA